MCGCCVQNWSAYDTDQGLNLQYHVLNEFKHVCYIKLIYCTFLLENKVNLKFTNVPKHHASKVQGMGVKLHRFLTLAFGECEQWFSYSYQFIVYPLAETNSNLKSVRENILQTF